MPDPFLLLMGMGREDMHAQPHRGLNQAYRRGGRRETDRDHIPFKPHGGYTNTHFDKAFVGVLLGTAVGRSKGLEDCLTRMEARLLSAVALVVRSSCCGLWKWLLEMVVAVDLGNSC